jgi:hypothetical protein
MPRPTKNILTELGLLVGTLILATIIYALSFGTSSLTGDTLDIAIHDTYFILIPLTIIGQVWTFLYFIFNLFRQISLRFNNILSSAMLTLTSVLLLYFVYSYIGLVKEVGDSLTIYPPLSAMPHLRNNSSISTILNTLWTSFIIVATIPFVTAVATIRKVKRHKA